VLTDLHNVLPLLQRNVGRAGVPSSTAVEVMPLPWGDASCARQVRQHLESGTQGKAALTHILCSDLVYFPELLAPLLRSLLHLTDCASGSGPMVVIAYKVGGRPYSSLSASPSHAVTAHTLFSPDSLAGKGSALLACLWHVVRL
jgi:hypothetical protein